MLIYSASIAIALYLILLVHILFFSSQKKSHSLYKTHSKKMPNITAITLSAETTHMISWILLALPALSYGIGLGAIWLAIGVLIYCWINWYWLLPIQDRNTISPSFIPFPIWLEQRFSDSTQLLKWISTLLIMAFFSIYTASGLMAFGIMSNMIFGLSYSYSILISVICIILYVGLSRFPTLSSMYSIPFFILTTFLVIIPFAVFITIQSDYESIRQANERSDLYHFMYNEKGQKFTFYEVLNLFFWGIGYFAHSSILSQVRTISPSENKLIIHRSTAILFLILILFGGIMTGISGAMIINSIIPKSEFILPILLNQLFHPIFSFALLFAIYISILGIVNSQLYTFNSVIRNMQLHHKMKTISVSGNTNLAASTRITVIILTILSAIIAIQSSSSIFSLFSFAWAGLGSSFGPLLLISAFWNRVNIWGALSGILIGSITVFSWKYFGNGLFELYELIPSFIFSCIGIVFISSLANPSSSDPTKTNQEN